METPKGRGFKSRWARHVSDAEMLCVVDERDNFLRNEERARVHSSKMWHRGVHVMLYNSEGELLLELRARTKDKFPNRWDAISEHVMPGESYEEAAMRSLVEELGITGVRLEPLLRYRMRYGRQDYMVCKLFSCRYDGPLKPNEETADLKWFNEKELKELLVKTRKLTPWAAEHLKWRFDRPHKLVIL